MRCRELDEAIAAVRRVVASRNQGDIHLADLRTALRELEAVKRGGKLDRRRIGRAVKLVCTVLVKKS